ncbi:hypothetical protein [Streptomyces sp. WZ-12]|uniref:hypothetical protein n=1 Tax=Streptomyces sp. WZ-12 TaxID=3030210 RepID=UPI002380F183|nr:hypothetical protein [Streptomyces sp. WZ-12]
MWAINFAMLSMPVMSEAAWWTAGMAKVTPMEQMPKATVIDLLATVGDRLARMRQSAVTIAPRRATLPKIAASQGVDDAVVVVLFKSSDAFQ